VDDNTNKSAQKDQDDQSQTESSSIDHVATPLTSQRSDTTGEWAEVEILGLLADAARIMNTSLTQGDVYPKFAKQLNRLLPFDHLGIAIMEGGRWNARLNHVFPSLPVGVPTEATIPIVDTILPDILQRGSGVVLSIEESDSRISSIFGGVHSDLDSLRSLLVAPVWWQGELIGSLNIGSTDHDAYTQNHLNIVERVVSVISGAIVNMGLHEQLQRRAEVSEIIAEIGRIASSSTEPENVMERTVELIHRLVPFDRIALNRIDMSTGIATRLFTSGREVPNRVIGQTMWIGKVAAISITRRQAIIRSEGLVYPEDGPMPFISPGNLADVGLVTTLAAPALARDEPVGELVLWSSKTNAYGPADADLALRVARVMAGLLDNARLRSQVEADSQARFISDRLSIVIADADQIEQLLLKACGAFASLVLVDQIEMFIHQRYSAYFPGHIAVQRDQLRDTASTACKMPNDLNTLELASIIRSEETTGPSVSDETSGQYKMWRDPEDHLWIEYEIELNSEKVGSIWLHWIESDSGLKKFEQGVNQAGRLLSESISKLLMTEKLKAASRTTSITNDLVASLVPGLSSTTLTQAFERSIETALPVDLTALVVIDSNPRNAPEIISSSAPLDEQRSAEILSQFAEPISRQQTSMTGSSVSMLGVNVLASRLSGSPINEYVALAEENSGTRIGVYLHFNEQAANLPEQQSINQQIEIWIELMWSVGIHRNISRGAKFVSSQPGSEAGIRWRTVPGSENLFSQQEIQTLLKVAEGFSNEEIGEQLHLSPGTVKNRLGQIYKQLGVTSRTGAIAAVFRAGYIEI
jgi:DNA-binding CsgD family transcriptional regulator/GAF domain-containing protein